MARTFSCHDDAQQQGDHATSIVIKLNPNIVQPNELLPQRTAPPPNAIFLLLVILSPENMICSKKTWKRSTFDLSICFSISFFDAQRTQSTHTHTLSLTHTHNTHLIRHTDTHTTSFHLDSIQQKSHWNCLST